MHLESTKLESKRRLRGLGLLSSLVNLAASLRQASGVRLVAFLSEGEDETTGEWGTSLVVT